MAGFGCGRCMCDTNLKYVEAFRSLGPPTFSGSSDPLDAEDWLRRVTKCMNVINVPNDNLRVELATLMLTGEAERWWELAERGRHAGTTTSWTSFEKRFRNIYVPKSLERDQKEREFEFLTQESMTVAQYVAKFIELSRYGDSLVGSEWLKIQEFIVGLRPSFGERVVTKFLLYHTFEDAVNEAYKIEMLGEIEEKRDDSDSN